MEFISNTDVALLEEFSEQIEHDDLRILDRYIETDKKGISRYYIYRLAVCEDDGEWIEFIKVVKICKVDHIPKELREKKSLMVIQDELLSALWSRDIQFLTVYANILKPKQLGLFYCYGIQVLFPLPNMYSFSENQKMMTLNQTLNEAKELADDQFSGLVKLLEGNYRQSQFRELTLEESECLRDTMEGATNLQVLRGIPKTHIASGNSVSGTMMGVTATPDAVEQNEEFIRGLLQDQYAVVVIASPIPNDELLKWSRNVARELSNYKSQVSGTISQNAGISVPMVFAGNMSASLGHNQGVSDTDSYNLSNSHGESVSASQNASDSHGLSRGFGTSDGHSTATGDSINKSISDAYSQGTSQSHATGVSQGVSENHGVSSGTSESLSRSQSLSHGTSSTTSEGWNQSLSKSHGVSNSISDSFGTSHGITNGTSHGTSDGTTTGTTKGYSDTTSQGTSTTNSTGNSHGTSSGTSNSNSQGISDSYGKSSSTGNSYNQGYSSNNGTSQSTGNSYTYGKGESYGESSSVGHSNSNSSSSGWSNGSNYGNSSGSNEGTSTGSSTGASAGLAGTGVNHSNNSGSNAGANTGTSWGENYGESGSNASSSSSSSSRGTSWGQSANQSWGNTVSNGTSQGYGESQGYGKSESYGDTHSKGTTSGTSQGTTNGISDSTSNSISNGISDSTSHGISNAFSNSNSHSISDSISNSISDSTNKSHSIGKGTSDSVSQGYGTSQSLSKGISDSYSQGVSQGLGKSHSISDSFGKSYSNSLSDSTGQSQSQSHGVGQGSGRTQSQGITQGLSQNAGENVGQNVGRGVSQGVTNSISEGTGKSKGTSLGTSDSFSTGQGLNFSFGPSIGVSRSYQVYDEVKNNLTKILEEQNTRLHLATRMGAFYVDMYILTHERRAKTAVGLLARSSFGGDTGIATVQIIDPDPMTSEHLLKHASAFVPCTQKEYIENIMEGYLWSTVMLTHELAALTHIPRVEGGGAFTVSDNIPPFSVMAGKKGDIYLGKQINYENGKAFYDFNFSKSEFMHTLVCGASGSGKTNTSQQIAKEVVQKYKDMRVFVLDWKNSWRLLKNFVDPKEFNFYSLDPYGVRPIKMNVYVPPEHVNILQWRDRIHESLCLAYGFGNKMLGLLNKVTNRLFLQAKVLYKESGSLRETPAARENIYKVTIKSVVREIQRLKEEAGMSDKERKQAGIDSSDAASGKGMLDAYDSILTKLQPYDGGELEELYCCTDKDKILPFHHLINLKRVVVLEGGDLDDQAKKFVISMITWGLFMYSRLRKTRERHVDKRFFILEEAHRIISGNENNNNPLQVSEDIFQILFNESREYGIYAMPIVQTPSHLPPNVITNCSIIIAHRLGQEDLEIMTQTLCRNGRIDSRDVPIWLTKQPKGQCIVRINNQWEHQMSEPVLIKVNPVKSIAPDDEELVMTFDLPLPKQLENKINDIPSDEFLKTPEDINSATSIINRMSVYGVSGMIKEAIFEKLKAEGIDIPEDIIKKISK